MNSENILLKTWRIRELCLPLPRWKKTNEANSPLRFCYWLRVPPLSQILFYGGCGIISFSFYSSKYYSLMQFLHNTQYKYPLLVCSCIHNLSKF